MAMLQNNQGGSCPCIDASSALASLSDRLCQLQPPVGGGDNDGIQLTVGGSCVPFSYGSSQCLLYDLLYDENCKIDNAGKRVLDAYCLRPFCYVHLDTCLRESNHRVYRSSYFPYDSGVDLYYSYSACNSTAEDWLAAEDGVVGSSERAVLGRVSIRGNVPIYQFPLMYKTDKSSGNAITSHQGRDYYDNNHPYEGVYIHYAKRIAEISKGDIQNITFTHRSKASDLVHPTSSYTAAVQDLEDGVADMAIGPFWITGQRLQMTSFTIPIVYDKTYLVIKKPVETDKLLHQVHKVFAPFSYELWGIVLGIIAATSLLSVWFSDKFVENNNVNRRMSYGTREAPKIRRRWDAYARLALDSFLEKGLFFCSAGVEQQERASLPLKVLLFGFGFFILVSVSAYVANLAAFLTMGAIDDVTTMEGVVAAGYKICAHPAVKAELEAAWPEANFFYHENGREFAGVLEDYDAGKCRVLAIGYEDTSMDKEFLDKICKRKLVYTREIVAELPIAFPIRPSLASGFSYWMYQGERYHQVSIQASKDAFPQDTCNVQFNSADTQSSDHDEVTVRNFFLPIVFFLACSVTAIILQLFHLNNVRKGKQSLVGRNSTLALTADAQETRSNLLARINKKIKDDDDSNESFGDNRTPAAPGSKKAIRFKDEDEQENDHDELFQRNDIRSILSSPLHLQEDDHPKSRKESEGERHKNQVPTA